jgi:Zn-dependent alcohol dehydrogenase
VCRAAGEPLAIEEVVVDTPKAHEVRIRIICTSLCHSDVTFWRMKVWLLLLCRPFLQLPAFHLLALVAGAYTASQACYTSFVCVVLQDLPDNIPRIFGHEAFG